MAEVKDKLVTLEALKAAYDPLNEKASLAANAIGNSEVTSDDLKKLHDITVSADDINKLTGAAGAEKNIPELISDAKYEAELAGIKAKNALDAAQSAQSSVDEHNHNGVGISPATIEMNGGSNTNGGYIDFHYVKGSEVDYTSRIIEGSSGQLQIWSDPEGSNSGKLLGVIAGMKTAIVTLGSSGWSGTDYTITVPVSGVSENSVVFASPSAVSYLQSQQCNIRCTAQATDSLTFACSSIPPDDNLFNVVIFTA